MLKTPREHLPVGYPLPSKEESEKYQPIFIRAFEIHATAHNFRLNKRYYDHLSGITYEDGPREGILSFILDGTPFSEEHYCDCYERAYREFEASGQQGRGFRMSQHESTQSSLLLVQRRRIKI